MYKYMQRTINRLRQITISCSSIIGIDELKMKLIASVIAIIIYCYCYSYFKN